jgi:hypothetical protein
MYAIYKWIDACYYGDKDDKNYILVKLEWLVKEEMWARAFREWQRIEFI